MSLKKAKDINKFLVSNRIDYINVMGGEFFMHPDWFNIMSTLCHKMKFTRIVTNGDWIKGESNKVKEFASLFPDSIYFAISKDRWHTNENIDAAAEFCSSNKILYKVATEDQTSFDSVVPIGRSMFEHNLYSFLACYCTKPERKYSFLVDEQGVIYKCPMGVWDYADVLDYIDGGFDERFKEFTSIFHSELISNCAACIRVWKRAGSRNVIGE
jgi:hypothetical protein